jgi:hypothetical protein
LHLAVLAILVPDFLAELHQAAAVEAAAVPVAASILLLAMFERAVVAAQWKWYSHLVVAQWCFQSCKYLMIPLRCATGVRKSYLFVEQIQN